MSLRNHNEPQVIRISPNMPTSVTMKKGYIKIENEKDMFTLRNWSEVYHTDRIRIVAEEKKE